MSRIHSLAMFVLLATVCLAAAAQQDKQLASNDSSLTLRSTTHMVVLDVVVAKRDGAAIDSLPQESFPVLEDGVPQKIVSFELPAVHFNNPNTTRTKNVAPYPENGPRSILVVDELDMDPIFGAQARIAVNKYLQGQHSYLQQPTALLILGKRRKLRAFGAWCGMLKPNIWAPSISTLIRLRR
ncbi:MAG: hypothetical protein ACXVZX_04945 [Terriglobales bacterium]